MSYDKYVFNDIGLISTATNIKKSENPPFKIEDFFAIYPQFQGLEELPDRIVKMYIDFANEVVNVERWGKQWVSICGTFLYSILDGLFGLKC